MYIYKITNNLNNKIYIGLKTLTVKESKSYYGSGTAIKNAIKKYGKHNFTKTILEHNVADWDLLKEREQYWIEYYDSYNNGYNMTLGGDGTLGHIVSDETKEKLRKAFKGKKIGPYSDERKAAIKEGLKNAPSRKGRKGTPWSDETRKKISKALKGKPMHPNTRKALLKAITGKPRSEETKKKISEATKGPRGKQNYSNTTCPHCNMSGRSANMTRYHFDNCKQKS